MPGHRCYVRWVGERCNVATLPTHSATAVRVLYPGARGSTIPVLALGSSRAADLFLSPLRNPPTPHLSLTHSSLTYSSLSPIPLSLIPLTLILLSLIPLSLTHSSLTLIPLSLIRLSYSFVSLSHASPTRPLTLCLSQMPSWSVSHCHWIWMSSARDRRSCQRTLSTMKKF